MLHMRALMVIVIVVIIVTLSTHDGSLIDGECKVDRISRYNIKYALFSSVVQFNFETT